VLIFHAKNNESLRRLVVVLSFRFCGMCRLLLFWWSKKAQKLKMQSHSLKRYCLSDGLEFDRTSAVENQIHTLPQSYHYAHRGLTDSQKNATLKFEREIGEVYKKVQCGVSQQFQTCHNYTFSLCLDWKIFIELCSENNWGRLQLLPY